ncbi:MAG: hypothetical protein WEC12_01335 [Balneolaceae bacterium]
MKSPAGISIRSKTWSDRLVVFFPALILIVLFVSVVHDYSLERRLVMMRYLLFVLSGILAFILPYISFPDSASRLFQLANLPSGRLIKEYIGRHRVVWGTGAMLIVVTALADERGLTADFPGQLMLLGYGILFLAGIYLYASCCYLKIGKNSQEWQEGEKGRNIRRQLAEIAKYPIDPGSIPSLISSVKIALLGMMAVVAGALAFGAGGPAGEFMAALLLFLFGLNRIYAVRRYADRFFYQTQAFFSEFFGVAGGPDSEQEPLKAEQLWWIPPRWKVHGWALMLQMDRKMPSGRFVAAGHLFIWILAYQDAGSALMLISWILFGILHHGLLLLTASPDIAPKWWLRNLDSPGNWSAVRLCIQVRWLLPLMLSMSIMKGLFSLFNWTDLGLTAGIYLLAGAVISLLISYRYERRWAN